MKSKTANEIEGNSDAMQNDDVALLEAMNEACQSAGLKDWECNSLAPYKTPVGAEGRTYEFRVEFESDLEALMPLVAWKVEKYWRSPAGAPWDVRVKMTLKEESTLTLGEIRWLFGQPVDCHVAMQSVELSSRYTGERKHYDEAEREAVMPKPAVLETAKLSLLEQMESYDFRKARGFETYVMLDRALESWKSSRAEG